MIFSLRRLVALASLTIAVGGASAVRAAEKSDEDSTPVSVLIGDAVAEYDAGHFQEARALFRQAHEKSPTARTLRGIGMCSFELRDYVEAARALAASLRDQRRPLTAEQKRHAEALLARAHTFIGRFTVHVKPATASLFVDGHPAELEPDGVLLLPFGRHQLSLRCPSCSPAEKDEDVEVSGGEHKELELALAPSPPVTPPTASGDGAGAGAGASGGAGSQPGGGERDTSADRGHAHLWFMGAAVAAALGAGGSALWWRDQQHQLDLCQDAGPRCSSGQSTVQDRRNIAIGTTIGLGAAAVAGGIVAALLWPHAAEQPTPAAALACVPGDKTVTCAFRF